MLPSDRKPRLEGPTVLLHPKSCFAALIHRQDQFLSKTYALPRNLPRHQHHRPTRPTTQCHLNQECSELRYIGQGLSVSTAVCPFLMFRDHLAELFLSPLLSVTRFIYPLSVIILGNSNEAVLPASLCAARHLIPSWILSRPKRQYRPTMTANKKPCQQR